MGDSTMTDAEHSRGLDASDDGRLRPSEAEVARLLQETVQQYEECMRLADLADISEIAEVNQPKYAWDNPIGLVVTGRSHAELV